MLCGPVRLRTYHNHMVRDGFFYAAGLFVVSAVLLVLTGSKLLALLPVLLALFFLWFFRDPSRSVSTVPGAVVSPADGKVTTAEWVDTPEGSRLHLSIFLNVFDVHVNRAPIAGTVTQVNHQPGLYLNAMRADSNVLNENTTLVLENAEGTVHVKQITGLLARRIVCSAKPGDRLERGQRYGLIKFGSRVDVLLPGSATLLVKVGDRVKGGSTTLASLQSGSVQPEGLPTAVAVNA